MGYIPLVFRSGMGIRFLYGDFPLRFRLFVLPDGDPKNRRDALCSVIQYRPCFRDVVIPSVLRAAEPFFSSGDKFFYYYHRGLFKLSPSLA